MIDVYQEDVFPIKKSPAEIPGRPHISTVIRWWQRGVRGVHLETILIGGIRYTSRQAIQRFIEATTTAADGEKNTRAPTNQRRDVSIRCAEEELKRAGM